MDWLIKAINSKNPKVQVRLTKTNLPSQYINLPRTLDEEVQWQDYWGKFLLEHTDSAGFYDHTDEGDY